MYNFLKTTVLGGVLFLVPVVVLIAILEKALGVAQKAAVPLADVLFQGTFLHDHAYVSDLLALGLLLVVCFLAGLAAKTSFARRSVDALEKKVLAKVPTYDSVKSKFLATLQSQSQEGEAMRPVLARFEDSWQIAFEVERIPGGIITVYVPGAPDPWSGSVCFMTEDRIQAIDPAMSPVMKTLKDLGKGSNEQLSAYFKHK
jgi:uncharacterized membrane protein